MRINRTLINFLLFFGVFLLKISCFSQSDTCHQIIQPSKYVITDPLSNIYIVTPKDKLLKYNVFGHKTHEFYDRTLGNISQIDATIPFQIMVFYADYQKIIWLDRTLNPISALNLPELGFSQVDLLCVSNDNGLWLYDNTTFQLKKINLQGDILAESPNLSEKIVEDAPTQILQKNNRIYLNLPTTGILVFDNFGSLIETIPLTQLLDFQVISDFIYYEKGGVWQRFNIASLQNETLILPFSTEKKGKLHVQAAHFIWQNTDFFCIFKY